MEKQGVRSDYFPVCSLVVTNTTTIPIHIAENDLHVQIQSLQIPILRNPKKECQHCYPKETKLPFLIPPENLTNPPQMAISSAQQGIFSNYFSFGEIGPGEEKAGIIIFDSGDWGDQSARGKKRMVWI